MLGGELELSFGAIGEWLHVEVAGTVEPFLVLLGGQRAEEAQATGVVGDSSGARKPATGSPEGAGNMRTTSERRLSSWWKRSRRLVLLRCL